MLNFLGVDTNFSVLAGVRWDCAFRFTEAAGGGAANLDGVQFVGAAYVGDEAEVYEFNMTRSAMEGHVLGVSVPSLPEGRWPFAIYATVETGERLRLMAGFVSALGKLPRRDDEVYSMRTLQVRLPGSVDKHIQLEWAASTVAQQAAEEAERAAAGAEEAVQRGVEAAQRAMNASLDEARRLYEDIKVALRRVEEIEARAEEIYGDLDELKSVLEEAKFFVESKIDSFMPRIGEDGYWYRGEECLYVRAEGRDGKDGLPGADGHDGADGRDGVDGKDGESGMSPIIQYVDTEVDGERYEGLYWFNWNADTKAYEFSKVRAEAKDGMDGQDADAFRSLYVKSTDDLPEVGDKNVIYYVPQYNDAGEVELYHMWRWLEHADGAYQWHNLFDTPTIDFFAQRDLENVRVLADDYEVNYPEGYLPRISWVKKAVSVIVNAAVAAINKLATVSVAGLIKLGTSNRFADGAWLAMNEEGQGVIAPAQTTRYGVVKPSTSILMTSENAGLIGMSADGQLMTYRAGYQRFGGVALSTQYEVTCNAANYCVTIPVADGKTDYNQYAGNMAGAIMFNLASEGCLRYNASGPNGTNRTNAMWLAHDDSLKIDEQGRLSLNVQAVERMVREFVSGATGGDAYATQSWVDTTWYNKLVSGTYSATSGQYKLGKYIDDKLSPYAKTADVNTKLSSYVTTTSLNNTLTSYAKTSALSSYVTTTTLNSTLSGYAKTSALSSYVTTTSLSNSLKNYAYKNELSDYIRKSADSNNLVSAIWAGTLANYNALGVKSSNTIYLIKE